MKELLLGSLNEVQLPKELQPSLSAETIWLSPVPQ